MDCLCSLFCRLFCRLFRSDFGSGLLFDARLLRSAQCLHFRFGFGALLSRAFGSSGGFLSFNRLFAAFVFGACVLLSSLLGGGLSRSPQPCAWLCPGW